MLFILIGIFLLAVAAYFLWNRRKKELKLERMLEANSLSLEDLIASIKSKKPLKEGVEVVGRVVCDTRLRAPFSLNEVVYYKCSISRIYQEKVTITSQDGRHRDKWESKTESVFEEEAYNDFLIDDGTGQVKVDLKGAELTPDISYQSTERGQLFSISERFSDFPDIKEKLEKLRKEVQDTNGDKDIYGFEIIEYSLPLHKDLFIMGGVGKEGEMPLLTKQTDMPFVVSIRSSSQVYEGIEDKLQRAFLLAIACGVTGVVLLFYGVKTLL